MKSSPSRARFWSRRARFLVLLLAVLQMVAPTWHVCSMSGNTSGNTHAGCDDHAPQSPLLHAPHDNARSNPVSSKSNQVPALICGLDDSKTPIEYSMQQTSSSSHDETSQHAHLQHAHLQQAHRDTHSHQGDVRTHVHSAPQVCEMKANGRCCTDEMKSGGETRAAQTLLPQSSPHEMTCLAMLLTTMPSQTAASIVLPLPVTRAVFVRPETFTSRGAVVFALCDARAPPAVLS